MRIKKVGIGFRLNESHKSKCRLGLHEWQKYIHSFDLPASQKRRFTYISVNIGLVPTRAKCRKDLAYKGIKKKDISPVCTRIKNRHVYSLQEIKKIYVDLICRRFTEYRQRSALNEIQILSRAVCYACASENVKRNHLARDTENDDRWLIWTRDNIVDMCLVCKWATLQVDMRSVCKGVKNRPLFFFGGVRKSEKLDIVYFCHSSVLQDNEECRQSSTLQEYQKLIS